MVVVSTVTSFGKNRRDIIVYHSIFLTRGDPMAVLFEHLARVKFVFIIFT